MYDINVKELHNNLKVNETENRTEKRMHGQFAEDGEDKTSRVSRWLWMTKCDLKSKIDALICDLQSKH